MKKIQGKSILVRVSECSSYRESTVKRFLPVKTLLKCFVPKYILLAFLSVLKFSKGFIYTRKYEKNKILLKYQYPLN